MQATPSNPVLPEDFGNPWMARLQEIALPEPVSRTPQTLGWYVLSAVLVLGLLWLAWRGYRRWSANRYRRQALDELEGLRTRHDDASRAVAAVPALLKRTALSAYPREQVAALSGEPWLAFLDATLATTEFTTGAGRILPRVAYEPAAAATIDEQAADALLSLTSRWIRGHATQRELPPGPRRSADDPDR